MQIALPKILILLADLHLVDQIACLDQQTRLCGGLALRRLDVLAKRSFLVSQIDKTGNIFIDKSLSRNFGTMAL
jgi:hypothetical protein